MFFLSRMVWFLPAVIVSATKTSLLILGGKILMILLAIAAVIYTVGKYLGYWKEDVWGKTELTSDKKPDLDELDDFF